MKRVISILLLSILLFGLALAVDIDISKEDSKNVDNTDSQTVNTGLGDPNDLKNILTGDDLKDELKNALKRNDTSTFTTQLPDVLEKPTRIIFNISSEEEVSLEKFVVLVSILIGFLVLLTEIVSFMPFFNKYWQHLVAGICITAIISISGSINDLSEFFFNLSEATEILASLGKWTLLIWIMVGIIVLIMFKFLADILKRKIGLEEAKNKGWKIGKLNAQAESADEATRILTS